MTEVSYVTRETVQHALNQADSVRNNRRIDDAIKSGSRAVEGLLHRRFYPELATRYPEPRNVQGRILWTDHIEFEFLSVATLTLDGAVASSLTDYYLGDGYLPNYGFGYTSIRLRDGGSASWPTTNRSIALDGEFGSSNVTQPAGALAAAIVSTSATTLTLTDSSLVGVGDLLTIDAERLIITEKTMADTGATVTGAVDASTTDVTIPVSNGTLVHEGELVLIGAERMFVEMVTGNTLIVKRQQNASSLATHANADVVYAPRLATVQRGALGTTAATHLISASIVRNYAPSLVQELALAYALNNLEQGRAAYARQVGQGEGARESGGRGIKAIEDDARETYGRVRSGAA